MEVVANIEINITKEALAKLKYFVLECSTEISGLGKVRVVKESANQREEKWDFIHGYTRKGFSYEEKTTFEIYDVVVLPQIASGAHSTIDEETLAKFLFERTKAKDKSIEDFKVWWHSHANMEAFFSVTDTNTIGASTEFPYLISIVTNHYGSIKCRLDLFKPIRLTLEDIDVKAEDCYDEKIRRQCQKEIKKNVSQELGYFGFRSKKRKKLKKGQLGDGRIPGTMWDAVEDSLFPDRSQDNLFPRDFGENGHGGKKGKRRDLNIGMR